MSTKNAPGYIWADHDIFYGKIRYTQNNWIVKVHMVIGETKKNRFKSNFEKS